MSNHKTPIIKPLTDLEIRAVLAYGCGATSPDDVCIKVNADGTVGAQVTTTMEGYKTAARRWAKVMPTSASIMPTTADAVAMDGE